MPQIDTRLPWLAQRDWTANNSVSHDLQTGYQLGQRNREMELREQYQASQLRSLEAYRQTQINSLLMRQSQMEAEQTDAALVTEWMRDPSQPPPAGLKTPKGIASVAAVQKTHAATQRQGIFGAVQKSYNDQLKDLDAMGLLKVQQALSETEGVITPAIATIIDTEKARIQTSSANLRVLDDQGQPFEQGGTTKPAFIQTPGGALHRLPQDYTTDNPVVPLEIDGKIVGYGIRNASGGITQLREQKTEQSLSAPERAAMASEFKIVNQWWSDLDSRERKKPEVQAELQRRIKALQDKYTPGAPTASPVTK